MFIIIEALHTGYLLNVLLLCRISNVESIIFDKASSVKRQRTPAFMHALVSVVAAAGEDIDDKVLAAESITARGGFTDVGRHTGSERRHTCWPLVREVIRVRGRHWSCVGEGNSLMGSSFVSHWW